MTKDFTTFALASSVPETADVPSQCSYAGSGAPFSWTQAAIGVNGSDMYLAAGGPSTGQTPTNTAYKISWNNTGGVNLTTLANLPVSVYGACGGVIGNKFYVFGGQQSASPYYTYTAYAYDLTAGTWSAVAAPPFPSEWNISCVYNGKLYVKPQYTSGNSNYSSTIYCYDPTTNTWSTVGSFSVTSAYDIMWAYKGGIYLKVGYQSSSAPSSTQLLRYDLATNTVSTKASCPLQDYGGSVAAMIGGFAYWFGGNSYSIIGYRYDCDNDKWTYFPTPWGQSQNTCAYFYGGTLVSALNPGTGNQKLLMCGCYSSRPYNSTSEAGYTSYGWQWEPRTTAPYAQNLRALKALAAV